MKERLDVACLRNELHDVGRFSIFLVIEVAPDLRVLA